MNKIYIVLIALFFISCSQQEPQAVDNTKKAFEDEDTYIMFGLRSEQLHDNARASDIFMTLFVKSNKKEYLYRSLENDLVAKNYEKVIDRVDKLQVEPLEDPFLTRLKVVSLFELGALNSAIELSVQLAAKTKLPDDYLLTSDIYVKRQEYDLAVKYLESAYAKEHNEKILDKLSIVLYVNQNRKKEAIAHLETHSRVFGCSKLVCNRLIAFYSNENDVEGLLSTYLRLYKVEKRPEVAKKIIQIYTYKRDYLNLQLFLENSGEDDVQLLNLYASTKNYNKAYKLADKLYKESSNPDYIGQSAIFEYEGAKDKNDKELLKSVVSKLKLSIEGERKPIYLNYLGYLLIDHEVDVKEGMKYIKEVLKIRPDSAYYLDSLAWGYYKLGACKKAQKVMNRVLKLEGSDEAEVQQHMKAIKQCRKTKKRGKK